ncbi:site-specific tyrosine recombinase XerD [Paenibacillus sp. CAA11]|uniref:site-specific tyrosine recombinase n=1 Tax=Paenibacillus sp. CAA11 TaxID=1532905 RepID=UPI000D3B36B9|nr:site-specific tyrosine recombinase [Paenibacillus sp. CAA11]AWB45068.1 site-specific tyrosine recombinase XerD [Paenibacillus sp. CAA11]
MREEKVADFISDLRDRKGLTESTLASYRRDLKPFMEFLEFREIHELREVNRTHLLLYLGELKKLGRAPSTITRMSVALKAFFRYLLRERFIDQDPFMLMDLPKAERKPQPKALSLEESERLLQSPDPSTPLGLRDKAMLELLYATGIRVSEIIMLNEEDLDLRFRFIRCAVSTGKERIIPFGEITAEWLRKYLSEGRPLLCGEAESSLFVNRQGRRISRQGFWKIMKRYGKEAGLQTEITPHSLRQAFAVHMLGSGADLKSVQELMGHAAIASTQVYIQKTESSLKSVYDQHHPRAKMQKSDSSLL